MEPAQGSGRSKMPAQLQSVLEYLRSEGLLSAEQALQKEIDEKYAVRPRPHGKSVAVETSRPSTPGDWGSMDRGPSSRQHSIGGYPPGDMDTAERVVELWRSRSFTATPSPQRGQLAHSRSPSGNLLMPSGATSPGLESLDADEYTDDDDPGFWRVEMNGTESAALFEEFWAPSEGAERGRSLSGRMGGVSPASSGASDVGHHSRRSSYDADAFRRMSSSGRPISLPTVPGGAEGAGKRATLSGTLSRRWSGAPSGTDSPRTSARAGTASWVYDRQNSGTLDGQGASTSGAFRSLLSHLDATGGRAGSPVRGSHKHHASSSLARLASNDSLGGGYELLSSEPATTAVGEERTVSRVSSLSESVLNGLAAAAEEDGASALPPVHKEPSLSPSATTQALIATAVGMSKIGEEAARPLVGSLGGFSEARGVTSSSSTLPEFESSFAVSGAETRKSDKNVEEDGLRPAQGSTNQANISDDMKPGALLNNQSIEPATTAMEHVPGSPMLRLGSTATKRRGREENESLGSVVLSLGVKTEEQTMTDANKAASAPSTPSADAGEQQSHPFTFAAPSPPPVVEAAPPSATRLGSRRLSWRGAPDIPSGVMPHTLTQHVAPLYAPLRSSSSNSLSALGGSGGAVRSMVSHAFDVQRRAESSYASTMPLLLETTAASEPEAASAVQVRPSSRSNAGVEHASPFAYGAQEPPISPESASTAFSYDVQAYQRQYEELELRIVARRGATGFEETKEFEIGLDDVLAGRYVVIELLGRAAFCRAVQAIDTKTGARVCLKVIKNSKDYFDQSLDEIKVLRHINAADPEDEAGILRLYDYFYYREHLVLVTELLRANLFEFQRHIKHSGEAPYFTRPRIACIARQVLRSLAFLHSLNLVHADLKPENIVMKSYSRCQVKVIDLGSSCFLTDRLSTYVQSRSYRAPEVILGLRYDQKIDIWSLGCILAELSSGKVLLQNESLVTLLARMESILGPLPRYMVRNGKFSHKYYTRDGRLFERNKHMHRLEYLKPKRTSLAWRLRDADTGMITFLQYLLQVDPKYRPTAEEALAHPWLNTADEH